MLLLVEKLAYLYHSYTLRVRREIKAEHPEIVTPQTYGQIHILYATASWFKGGLPDFQAFQQL